VGLADAPIAHRKVVSFRRTENAVDIATGQPKPVRLHKADAPFLNLLSDPHSPGQPLKRILNISCTNGFQQAR